MSEENMLIIKQINKFGRVLRTPELLKMIEDLEQEKDELQQENQELKKYKSIVDNFMNYLDKNRLVLNNPAILDFYQAIKEVK